MITRGHSCLRRSKLSSFLDNVVIPASNSEPLQFLYPLFAKDLLAKSHARPSTTSRARLPRQLTPFRSRNQLDRGNSRRFLTQDAICVESRGAGVAEVSAHKTTTEPNCGRGGFLERFDGDRSLSSGNSSTASQIKHEREYLYASNEEGAFEEPESRDQHVDITNMEPDEAPSERESIEVSPMIRIVLTKVPTPEEKRRQALIRSREEALARSLSHVTTPGQAKKIRYRAFTASRPTSKSKMPPHWTELMARLEKMQNETIVTPHKGARKEILLREETVAFFSGTTRSMENIWYVRVRNGCKVQALDCLESEGIYRRVILSGTKRTIELVEKQFRQYDEQILQSGLPPVVPSMLALRQQGKTPPLIRSWWFAAPNNDHRSKIPEPASDAVVTNIRSFNRLIEQWVYHEPSVKEYWHAHRVKDELVNIFTKPEYKLYHSSNALHLALNFLTDHEFLDSARSVFEAARMVATTNTFNVFLRATAKRQNPWYYESILTEMERSGLQPNGHTWITLLRFLVSPGPRREVMRRMKELGLTDDIRVLHDMVENDLGLMVSNFLSENRNIQTFIDSLKQDYGSDLVTTNLLNGVLNATFLRRDFALTSDILKCYERFGLSLNARTFTAALPVFYRIGPAVEIMTPYLRDYEHLLNQRHYEMLFLDAIASNAFNACRVIWKYACMRGEVSPKMQHIVLLSLLGTSKTRQMDNPEHITYHIGALVIGLPYSLAQRSKSSSTTTTTSITKAASLVPPQFQRDPLIYLLHKRNHLRHSEKKKLVTALMEEDVKQGHNYRPVEPFTVMLDAAVRLDSSPEYSWDQSKVDSRPALKKLPTIDILKQAIDVPIE